MKPKTDSNNLELTDDTLKGLLDYLSDEIIIFNRYRQVIYANKACERNYGLSRDELLGEYSHDLFAKKYWTPSIYPEIYKLKKPISVIQSTITGTELLTSAIPILNNENEVELLITTARKLTDLKMITLHTNDQMQTIDESGIISFSDKMKHIISFCKKVAVTKSTILIQGETGTGKGILSNFIHQVSERKNQPFLMINCATIPEELLESELFGYVGGAFTGSNPKGKIGLLESANNGTVFLDEIGDMSIHLQAKLLQVLQENEFIPIGGVKKKKINIRFIAATNRNLEKMIENGDFREDLYYRLNVIDITVPPLRDRKEDIIPLILFFVDKFNNKYEMNKRISEDCLDILVEYPWPGNIRQLENLIEKLIIISDNLIDTYDLPDIFFRKEEGQAVLNDHLTMHDALEETRKHMIKKSFKKYKSSRKVAQDLNISQTTASRLIKKHCHHSES